MKRNKKKIRLIISFFIMLAILFIYLDQKRYFFALPNNQSITVWKRLGNKCYITSGEYYGLCKPANYIQTSNVNSLTLFFTKRLPKEVFLDGENCKIYNNSEDDVTFNYYIRDKHKNVMYKKEAKKISDVYDDVTIINIDIGWMNVTDKYGHKIKQH